MPKFNPLKVWLIPDQHTNESLHKTDCCNVLSDCWLYVHSPIKRLFPAAAAAATGLWTEPQTGGAIVSFLSFGPVYVFFYLNFFFYIVFDYNYFQAIQTAVFL